MIKPPLVVIAGPTASGKTSLSISLAHRLGGEVVAMDSMQIYRHMNIGTAKPSIEEQEGIPHFMLDVVDPHDSFSVAEYAAQAKRCIQDIHERGKLPFLTGGTGLYLQALITSMALGGTQGDSAIRQRLTEIANSSNGAQTLHHMLWEVDAVSAARLHPNDIRRVIRALEVFELTGKPFSAQQPEKGECPYALCIIGLFADREKLCRRIDSRVEEMMAAGLMREVEGLLAMGVPPSAQAMQGLGYKELVPVFTQGLPIAAAVEAIKTGTRQYAKRQMTWFRRTEGIVWIDALAEDHAEQAYRYVLAFLKGHNMDEGGK